MTQEVLLINQYLHVFAGMTPAFELGIAASKWIGLAWKKITPCGKVREGRTAQPSHVIACHSSILCEPSSFVSYGSYGTATAVTKSCCRHRWL